MSTPAPSASRTVFQGKLIGLVVETWPAGEREVVHHPGAVAVVAVTKPGDVVLVRQFRESVRQRLLEIPAGVLDVEGEDAAAAALRELHEETGYRAEAAEPIAEVFTSPGFADERITIFVARDAEPTDDPPEEGIEVLLMPFQAALDSTTSGAIQDAKSIAGLYVAGRHLGIRPVV